MAVLTWDRSGSGAAIAVDRPSAPAHERVLGLGETRDRKRVARLIPQAGTQGIHRRPGRKNLVNAATEEDLVHRQFAVAELDRLWLTDITEHSKAEGKMYCEAVMDACSINDR
jgi:putative transposase